MRNEVTQILLLLILSTAIVSDLRSRRIPNWLTGPGILLGLGIHTFMDHWEGLKFSLEGIALGLGLFLILYMVGWIGAGDVKLYAVVGSFLGPFQTLSAAIIVALMGGLLAIFAIGFHSGWRKMGVWLRSCIQTLFLVRSAGAMAPVPDKALKLPYAVAIGLGTVGSYWWSPLG